MADRNEMGVEVFTWCNIGLQIVNLLNCVKYFTVWSSFDEIQRRTNLWLYRFIYS